MSQYQKDVKCHMSNSQAPGLWRRFTKRNKLTMRFTDIDVNFDMIYKSDQNWSQILSMDILRVFMPKTCQKSPFWHIFGVFKYLIGPLVAK